MAKTEHIVLEKTTKNRLVGHVRKNEKWKTPNGLIDFLIDLYERSIEDPYFWLGHHFDELKKHYPAPESRKLFEWLYKLILRYFHLFYNDDKEEFVDKIIETYNYFGPCISEEYKCLAEKVEEEAPTKPQNSQ